MYEIDEIKLNFIASTFLECISDEYRRDSINYLKNYKYNEIREIDDIIKIIRDNKYEEIMSLMKEITSSEMLIMFQVKNGNVIDDKTHYKDIVLLSESDYVGAVRKVPILRSELLKFYRNTDISDECKNLLDIQNSLKIVKIGNIQSDGIVGTYKRKPCIIAYVEIGYSSSTNKMNDNRLYLSFFFGANSNLAEILNSIRRFFLFKYIFLERIQIDFERNLYGLQKEEDWRNQWLSIEKAGNHADSKLIDDIIQDSLFSTYGVDILFFKYYHHSIGTKTDNDIISLQLIANIIIARYFRMLFSPTENHSSCYGHFEPSPGERQYCCLGNILHVTPSTNTIKYKDNTVNVYFDKSINDIDKISLYHKKPTESDRIISGLPSSSGITYSRKYLVAFMIDIFNNIIKYGKNASLKIEMTDLDAPSYLVIENDLKDSGGMDYLDKNYNLKQSIEFDNAESPSEKRGISLGCLNHFMGYFGNMHSYFFMQEGQIKYCLKLPIIN